MKKGDVNRQRPERLEVGTIPGTRKIHAAVGISPYVLNVRRLSCFCDSCLFSQANEACHNNGYVSEWSEKQMKTKWIAATANVPIPDVRDVPEERSVPQLPHFDMDEIYEHLQETEGDDTLHCSINYLQPDSVSSITHAPSHVEESTLPIQMTTSEFINKPPLASGIIDAESPILPPVNCSTPVPATLSEVSPGENVPTQECHFKEK